MVILIIFGCKVLQRYYCIQDNSVYCIVNSLYIHIYMDTVGDIIILYSEEGNLKKGVKRERKGHVNSSIKKLGFMPGNVSMIRVK